MKRREFIKIIAGSAVAWPLPASAQQSERMRRVGVLIGRAANDPEGKKQAETLQRGLEQLGWSSGRNVEIHFRWQTNDAGTRLAFAKELVERKPDVLVVNSTPYLIAARQATGSIPIVFVAIADPVAQNFVQSLAHPGGLITGFGVEEPSMGAKWLELLREAAPLVGQASVLFNPNSAPFARMFLPSMQSIGLPASFKLIVSPVRDETELDRAITSAGRQPSSGLIFLPDSFFASRRETVVALVSKQNLPAIYADAAFVRSSGLIAFGVDRVDLFHRAAAYVDRILKGDKPADLPVQMPTKFELVINLRTAKLLGLDVPATLLARADEVIE
jgi:putative ABC transport system substrate-binding protein